MNGEPPREPPRQLDARTGDDSGLPAALALRPPATKMAAPPSLHRLECMKVLLPRFPAKWFTEFFNKEWWYTGIYDPRADVYVSWYFIRVNFLNKLTMTVFDPKRGDPKANHISKYCYMGAQSSLDGLDLKARGWNLKAAFRLQSPGRWRFDLTSKGLQARVEIDQRIAAFTKFDNELKERYAIIHYFQNRANGEIVAGGRRYDLKDALVYQDHCYGRVPRNTGWHWIAVQSDHVALTVLVNYGPRAQRFAQIWMDTSMGSPRANEWVRLEQNVSFEQEDHRRGANPKHGDQIDGAWRVTSTDLDLTIEPRPAQSVTDRTRLLPMLGVPVDLHHTESFVKVSGRVRVDGRWLRTGTLDGVMEQHHGTW